MAKAGVRTAPRTLQTRLVVLALMALGAGALATASISAVAVIRLRRQADADRTRLIALADGQISRALRHDLEQLQGLASRLSGRSEPVDPGAAVREAYLSARYLDAVFLVEAGHIVAQEPRDVAIARLVVQDTPRPGGVATVDDCGAPLAGGLGLGAGDSGLGASSVCSTYVLLRATNGQGGMPVTVGGVLNPSSHRVASLIESVQQALGDRAVIVDARGRALPSGVRVTVDRPPDRLAAALPWQAVPAVAPGCCGDLFDTTSQRVALPALAVLAAVLLAFAWGAARSVARPIDALTRASERMASGDMDVPLPETSADEVGRLGAAFDRMRVSLRDAMGAAETANRELEARVEERTRELQRLYAELQARDRGRERLLRQVISAQEEERKRIARDLHDDTCQMLGAIAMHLALAEQDPTAMAVGELRQLVQRTTDGVRRQIYDLRPSALDDLGLVDAIRAHAERHLRARGVDVRLETDIGDVRLGRDLEIAVFRAVQELITNIERHAAASHVVIEISEAGGRLTVDIEDDGRGFDWASTSQAMTSGGGMGLIGVRERVALAGGTIQIDSAPGRGTHAHVEIPMEN
jgi:signal transduction histidine kinase